MLDRIFSLRQRVPGPAADGAVLCKATESDGTDGAGADRGRGARACRVGVADALLGRLLAHRPAAAGAPRAGAVAAGRDRRPGPGRGGRAAGHTAEPARPGL